jgi:hypothetical protein
MGMDVIVFAIRDCIAGFGRSERLRPQQQPGCHGLEISQDPPPEYREMGRHSGTLPLPRFLINGESKFRPCIFLTVLYE